jgi:hypothetical protein
LRLNTLIDIKLINYNIPGCTEDELKKDRLHGWRLLQYIKSNDPAMSSIQTSKINSHFAPLFMNAIAQNTTLRELALNVHLDATAALVLALNTSITKLNNPYSSMGDTGLKALMNHPSITDLSLLCNGIVHEEFINSSSQLTRLDLTMNKLHPNAAKMLSYNTNIRALNISSNRGLQKSGLILLSSSRSLTELNISGCNLDNETFKEVASNIALKTFKCGNNLNLKLDSIETLALSSTLTNLDLTRACIGDDAAQVLATNTTLRSLNLQRNNIGVKGVVALSNNTTLKKINLEENRLTIEAVKTLAEWTTITSLDVSTNKLVDECAILLASNTSLQKLNVCANRISDRGAEAIAHNTTLRHINISHNKLTKMSADLFILNPHLTQLIISHNTLKGVQSLFKKTSLLKVVVERAELGDITLKDISTNTNITSMDIRGCQITSEGAAALAANTTLVNLNHWANLYTTDDFDMIEERVFQNRRYIINTRSSTVVSIIVILLHSTSSFEQLPFEVIRMLASFLIFPSFSNQSRSATQIHDFIAKNAAEIKKRLKVKKSIHIIEHANKEKTEYRFVFK